MSVAATVLIPTFDHGPTLLRSVPSALAQTVEELEVFVVGDGVPDETREIMAGLTAADERVRFFDNPKGPRHGEVHRHAALREARGAIVAYLSDDDLWLPHHLEELRALLEHADVAHTLPFGINPDGTLHVGLNDLSREYFRNAMLGGESRIHLSITAHTLELYRRLPAGWVTTPPGIFTDLYFWQRLILLAEARPASGFRPTVLHFPSTQRHGWSVEERLEELDAWSQPHATATLEGRLLESALPDRTALEEGLAYVQQQNGALSETVERLERERSEAQTLAARLALDLDTIAHSATWRLRKLLVRVPGLRGAVRPLARPAARAATGRPRPVATPAPRQQATESPDPDPPSDSQARPSDPSTR